MPAPVSDFYQRKTTAELLFFVRNPAYYQPELVAGARRELQRRGELPAAALPEPATPASAPAAPEAAFTSRAGLGALLTIGVLVLSALGIYVLRGLSGPRPTPAAANVPAPKKPVRLAETPTSVLPDYTAAVDRCVAQQLARVPAAEKADERLVQQYRALARRFWAAQTLTEHLQQEPPRDSSSRAGYLLQAGFVQTSWEQWNIAARYRYEFGPVMQEHVDRMQRAARHGQEMLAELPDSAKTSSGVFARRHANVQDLLAGLRAESPVTRQPYRAIGGSE